MTNKSNAGLISTVFIDDANAKPDEKGMADLSDEYKKIISQVLYGTGFVNEDESGNTEIIQVQMGLDKTDEHSFLQPILKDEQTTSRIEQLEQLEEDISILLATNNRFVNDLEDVDSLLKAKTNALNTLMKYNKVSSQILEFCYDQIKAMTNSIHKRRDKSKIEKIQKDISVMVDFFVGAIAINDNKKMNIVISKIADFLAKQEKNYWIEFNNYAIQKHGVNILFYLLFQSIGTNPQYNLSVTQRGEYNEMPKDGVQMIPDMSKFNQSSVNFQIIKRKLLDLDRKYLFVLTNDLQVGQMEDVYGDEAAALCEIMLDTIEGPGAMKVDSDVYEHDVGLQSDDTVIQVEGEFSSNVSEGPLGDRDELNYQYETIKDNIQNEGRKRDRLIELINKKHEEIEEKMKKYRKIAKKDPKGLFTKFEPFYKMRSQIEETNKRFINLDSSNDIVITMEEYVNNFAVAYKSASKKKLGNAIRDIYGFLINHDVTYWRALNRYAIENKQLNVLFYLLFKVKDYHQAKLLDVKSIREFLGLQKGSAGLNPQIVAILVGLKIETEKKYNKNIDKDKILEEILIKLDEMLYRVGRLFVAL